VIASADIGRYAFFRGETSLQVVETIMNDPFGGQPEPSQQAESSQRSDPNMATEGKRSLRSNLFNQNSIFQEVQKGNYDDLMNNDRSGIMSKEAF
jgi:hypothetical protein